jgi:PncC family amidohydrolase
MPEHARYLEVALSDLVWELISAELTLATAESFTGGLCSFRIVDIPDSGQVHLGGLVAYDSEVKRRLLGVTADRVVSAECALQMAAGVRALFGSRCALSFTGVAGPTEQEGRPVGTAYVVARVDDEVSLRECRFTGGPNDIRDRAIELGVALLTELIRHR